MTYHSKHYTRFPPGFVLIMDKHSQVECFRTYYVAILGGIDYGKLVYTPYARRLATRNKS